MNLRKIVGLVFFLLVMTLPATSALSLPWSGLPVFGTSSGAYPIHLDGVEQSGNIAVVTWNVPPNCLSGYGTVLISKDGGRITERVSLGGLKPWGKKVAVFLNVREPVYVKLRITSGNGVFMGSWVRLTPQSAQGFFSTGYTATYPVQKGEIRPQFIQIPILIKAIISVGFALWDAYDAYNACSDYGEDSIKCTVAAGSVFVFSLAVEGDELVGVLRHGDELVEVPGKLYSTLKRLDLVEEVGDGVVRAKERFAHIFDDIVKHGDDAAKALDDLVRAGVSKEAVEETVKHGATIKEIKEGVKKFAEKSSSFVVSNSGNRYKVVLEKGTEPEKSGLLHAFLRHVWGYEMTSPRKPITTFWPLGQKIIDPETGRVVQLPKVFRDEEGLREFLDEVLEKALKDPEYRKQFFKNGAPNRKFGIPVGLKKLGMHVDGIDVVQLEFKFEKGEFVLKTAYPEKGSAVWEYNRYLGWRVKR
ncbi:hypothetical protein APY94_08565 [Thermococcus celericrescens]|uniref:Uncharacterized protein n=1 Tax=Thermococcus celericrescens TaxID=227598 RepID=A0A100XX88_9EURY|nr:hypothetical protein [Thermococcus celericrescens]KUH32826.1 hypothetical protein APY94_08565 [Thermococcus celericrescens]